MGFLIKSAFWLGIVYSAMPLGAISVQEAASSLAREACGPAGAALIDRAAPADGAYRLAAASGSAALAAPAIAARPAPAVAGPRPSTQTLTEDDRRPPWMGRERRALAEEQAPDWRVGHPSDKGKRVAAAHRERHTADD